MNQPRTVGQSCKLFTVMTIPICQKQMQVYGWIIMQSILIQINLLIVQKFFNKYGFVAHVVNLNRFTIQNILDNIVQIKLILTYLYHVLW